MGHFSVYKAQMYAVIQLDLGKRELLLGYHSKGQRTTAHGSGMASCGPHQAILTSLAHILYMAAFALQWWH